MTIQDRIEACARALEAHCRESGVFITGDGRISEVDAAGLLGLAPGTLKNMRGQREGPAAYRTPINGCRVSYRILDLAGWVEVGRDDGQH